MAGVLTKGITLGYSTTGASEYTTLTNLQEIPEIGNTAPERIEVTVLTDDAKKYIAGLGDTGQDLGFKFLYEEDQFKALAAIGDSCYWVVTLPDGIAATFKGTPSVKFDSAAPNAALTYTLTVSVESSIAFN